MANPKELPWQYKIIKSVRLQGGYGKKWSSTYAVGVPDLILSHPDFGTAFMEAKLEHSIKDGYDRKIDITERQRHELSLLRASGALALIGVVIYRSPRDVRLWCLPPTAERVADGMDEVWVPWVAGSGFNMRRLIESYLEKGHL